VRESTLTVTRERCSFRRVAYGKTALIAGAVLLGWPSIAVAGPAVAASPSPIYVFSFPAGLRTAPIGATAATYKDRFRTAVQLHDWGSKPCTGLAYAVSAAAKRTRTPDLLLFCGNKATISEVHLRSSAFCSTGGICVDTVGSLRGFAAELGRKASVQTHAECGIRGCSIVVARYGKVEVALRSANCPNFTRLAAISRACTASEVLIYRQG
jgi:hypothetical protein